MSESKEQLTLKKILGAMLFAVKKPISLAELKKIFIQTAAEEDEETCRQFSKARESEICAALEQIKVELLQIGHGIRLAEVAGGFRLQTDPECSPWLRQLLNSGRPSHLSKPTLETLAIIAYRQPVTRAEIESVRGVNVDSIVRHLLECQLIKIIGRSSLPGHPMLYGTSQLFLEHFGLQSISHLPGIEQLRRKEEEKRPPRPAQPEPEEGEESETGGEEKEQNLPAQEAASEEEKGKELPSASLPPQQLNETASSG